MCGRCWLVQSRSAFAGLDLFCLTTRRPRVKLDRAIHLLIQGLNLNRGRAGSLPDGCASSAQLEGWPSLEATSVGSSAGKHLSAASTCYSTDIYCNMATVTRTLPSKPRNLTGQYREWCIVIVTVTEVECESSCTSTRAVSFY